MKRLKSAYEQFFYQTLPEICAAEDPDHPYWPSSPSSGRPFDHPNDQSPGRCPLLGSLARPQTISPPTKPSIRVL